LRELSILDLVQEERRDWVKAQLMNARQQERQSESETENQKSKPSPTTSENNTSPMSHAMGNGKILRPTDKAARAVSYYAATSFQFDAGTVPQVQQAYGLWKSALV
ncbi:hypothetical protein KEM55_000907, partial [Ascosphaera atra]